MGIFKSLFSKKKETSAELEVAAPTNMSYLEEAEEIANVVSEGIERENYSGINQQLTIFTQKDEERQAFVFEHPGVISRFYAIVICALLSMAFAYYLFIGVGTSWFSFELQSVGMFFVGASVAALVVNIVVISRLVSAIKFKSRFDVYEELLGYRSLEFVDDLAICSNQKVEMVVKDLQRATKQKLIPQGHFSNENRVFMISNEVYNRYMEKPAVYDRYFQKMIEERKRVKSRTKRISQIMETGEQYVQKLNGYASLVKDKALSRKIGRMESIVSMIFHEIDVNPSQAQSLGVFLNYYLPTTEKLLEAYVTIDEKQTLVKSTTQTRKEIETAINTIVSAFEGILEKLYEEQKMDITSDIAAIELSMKQEGLPI